MKLIFVSIFGFIFLQANAQNLYLQLRGYNEKEDSIISNYSIKKKFNNFKKLKEASNQTLQELKQNGYYNLRNESLEALNDSIYLQKIKLNQKYNHVYLKNHEKFSKILQDIEPHIKVIDLQDFFDAILNRLSKAGKPFSQIQLDEIEFDHTDTIQANLVLNQSNERTLDEIVIRGYDEFPTAFLKNYSGIKTGITFDKDRLLEKSNQIRELIFANQTKTPQVQFTQDSTKLFMYLERQQANSFDGFIGFNNSDENDFQLNGNIDFKLINNFNGGEEINLSYKNDGNAQEWFDLGLRLPYLFKSRFSVEGGLNFFKQDSTFSNNTQELKLDYQLGQSLNIGLKVAFETSTNLLSSENKRDDIQDFDKSQYGIEMVYQTSKRYSNLFLNNQYINFGFGIGQRETLGDKQDQRYFDLVARQIFKLDKRQYIYIRLNAGYLNSDRFINNELFRFGGVNSMRGFAENRFFTNLYGTIQTEYRYILGSNLYVHSVLDYGFYDNEIDRFNENLYSLGVGFGLETQAGVLRLIFANGGSDSQNLEFKNTQIHLKFISMF